MLDVIPVELDVVHKQRMFDFVKTHQIIEGCLIFGDTITHMFDGIYHIAETICADWNSKKGILIPYIYVNSNNSKISEYSIICEDLYVQKDIVLPACEIMLIKRSMWKGSKLPDQHSQEYISYKDDPDNAVFANVKRIPTDNNLQESISEFRKAILNNFEALKNVGIHNFWE